MKRYPLFIVAGRSYRYDEEPELYLRVLPPPGVALDTLSSGYETRHTEGLEIYFCEDVYYRYDPESELYIEIPEH